MPTDLSATIARGASGRPEAADADPQDRPGVPIYKPAGTSAPLSRPTLARQSQTVPVLVGADVGGLTPVFGTAQPPRGLSGAIRRAAYRIPEHRAAHWMLLLLGDRVDVWESRAARNPVVTIALIGGAVSAVWQLRRMRRRSYPHRLLERLL